MIDRFMIDRLLDIDNRQIDIGIYRYILILIHMITYIPYLYISNHKAQKNLTPECYDFKYSEVYGGIQLILWTLKDFTNPTVVFSIPFHL